MLTVNKFNIIISNDKPFFLASESQVEQHKMASRTPETLLKLIQIKNGKGLEETYKMPYKQMQMQMKD